VLCRSCRRIHVVDSPPVFLPRGAIRRHVAGYVAVVAAYSESLDLPQQLVIARRSALEIQVSSVLQSIMNLKADHLDVIKVRDSYGSDLAILEAVPGEPRSHGCYLAIEHMPVRLL